MRPFRVGSKSYSVAARSRPLPLRESVGRQERALPRMWRPFGKHGVAHRRFGWGRMT
jgi:hypothetical protein